MPKLGESITEVTIIKWIKNVGEMVVKDEIILETSIDKIDSDISAPVTGKIAELLANDGDAVDVGSIIARIETEDIVSNSLDSIPEEIPTAVSDSQVSTEIPVSDKDNKPISNSNRFYSPVVLSIARNQGINSEELDQIPGTGINGRVSKNDILRYIQAKPVLSKAVNLPQNGEEGLVQSMDLVPKKIGDHILQSSHISPPVNLITEVDMHNIYYFREQYKNSFFQREGVKLTYMPFISEAVTKSLKEFPYVNSSINGDNIIVNHFVNLGIMVSTGQGLLIPIIKNAENINLVGFARAINDLAFRARSKKLTPDDMSGGTFSISNFGVYGTTIGFPLINQSRCAILGVGVLKKRAIIIDDAIAIRPMMNISLTFDHRLVDEEMGSKFLQRVSRLLTEFDNNIVI